MFEYVVCQYVILFLFMYFSQEQVRKRSPLVVHLICFFAFIASSFLAMVLVNQPLAEGVLMICLLLSFLLKWKPPFTNSNKKNQQQCLRTLKPYPLPLIVDGMVNHEALKELRQTELWLRQKMRDFGFKDIRKISYCSLKGDSRFFIDPY